MMSPWRSFDRRGVKLSVLDFGGEGPPVLFLHGLAGHAGEWAETASWLTEHHHVLGLDTRGHGRSERFPGDVSADAQVADVAFIIEKLALESAILVGQSMGGLTALMVAARHPERVRALVLVEAAPSDGDDPEEAARYIADALRSWPVPFPSQKVAAEFFRDRFGDGAALPWADGLEERADGWRPRFDVEVMGRMLGEMLKSSSWADWQALSCPVLVVRAEHGDIEDQAVSEMAVRLPGAKIIDLPEARHDLHLDRPQEWRGALSAFITSLD
jgi:pimeloyl-ACP methyl ester carboxylesterase